MGEGEQRSERREAKRISSDLGGYSFGETVDGQPGFRKPGADTVIPFSNPTKLFAINPLYIMYRMGNSSTYNVISDMPANEYFEVTTAGARITCVKACTLKVYAWGSGDPDHTAGDTTVYHNGKTIISTGGGTGRSGFAQVDVIPGDYITWTASGYSGGGHGICLFL